jgi:hypothetical protein
MIHRREMMKLDVKIEEVPLPERMKHLPRDHRGFPEFWMIYRDPDGRGHFTINDEFKRRQCIEKGLCSICGQPLFRGRWFVGGPLCATHEHGWYLDPPMHDECVHYALKVCPYLAAPHWGKEIGAKTLKEGTTVALVDQTMIKGRPPLFIAVMGVGVETTEPDPWRLYIRPKKPHRKIEYWLKGQQISAAEAYPLVEEAYKQAETPDGYGERG